MASEYGCLSISPSSVPVAFSNHWPGHAPNSPFHIWVPRFLPWQKLHAAPEAAGRPPEVVCCQEVRSRRGGRALHPQCWLTPAPLALGQVRVWGEVGHPDSSRQFPCSLLGPTNMEPNPVPFSWSKSSQNSAHLSWSQLLFSSSGRSLLWHTTQCFLGFSIM